MKDEIDNICNDAMPAPDVGVPVDETCEHNGVITMKFTNEKSPVVFQHEGDTPNALLSQIEGILTGLVRRGLIRPRRRNGNGLTDSSAKPENEDAQFKRNAARKPSVIDLGLKLFPKVPKAGRRTKSSFSTIPTDITSANASKFFQHGYTPILFKNGDAKCNNFEYATAIPFIVDNLHCTSHKDWVLPDGIGGLLKAFGIRFVLATGWNLCPNDVIPVGHLMIYGYLPLSEPLYDSDKFVRYCQWCIRTLGGNPKVKSKALMMCGYDTNRNSFRSSWFEGRCIDEVLTDDDLVTTRLTKKVNADFGEFIAQAVHGWTPLCLTLEEQLMNDHIKKRVREYIRALAPIRGDAKRVLFDLGIRLRLIFGLRRYRLKEALSKANKKKCNSPLGENVVEEISRRVDKAPPRTRLELLVLRHRGVIDVEATTTDSA